MLVDYLSINMLHQMITNSLEVLFETFGNYLSMVPVDSKMNLLIDELLPLQPVEEDVPPPTVSFKIKYFKVIICNIVSTDQQII